jgi:hypothetical protein
MAEVIRLAESHVDPDVMLAFIQNSGQTYSPTADEILYLSHLGVPQTVIAALFPAQSEQSNTIIAATSAPTPAAVPDTPPPQEATSNLFTEALAPYGNWVQVPGYGAAWQPSVEVANPDWKPYVDDGQWINSDSGWYWQSEYPWGWAPFHYGGWIAAGQWGWVWVPGKTWGPAWVSWRSTSSYVGWAALPPGVSLNVLSQLTFSGHPINPEFDFGLSLSSYVFVRSARFLTPNLPGHIVSAPLAASSTVANNYSVVNNKIINGGVNRTMVAAAVNMSLPEISLEPVSNAPEAVHGPALLASARSLESDWPWMQLPPLHSGPPPVYGRHDPVFRPTRPAPPALPDFRGPEPALYASQPRRMEESRSAPRAATREATPSSSSSKSTK